MSKDQKTSRPEIYCNISVACPYIAFAITVLYGILWGMHGGREYPVGGLLAVAMRSFALCCLIGLLCGIKSLTLKKDNNRDAWLAVAMNAIPSYLSL